MTQSINLGQIANGSGASVRSGMNNGFLAVVTESEGSTAPNPTWPYMLWRNNTTKILYRRNAANSGWEIVTNYGATTDPTIGDDAADNYIEGSTWVNVTGNRWFVCTDQTTGAAVWRAAGSSGDTVSVKDYGAVGDGTTNDTTAVQNAFTAAASAGKTVDLGKGIYRCTTAITATNLRGIIGDGKSIAALVWDNTTDGGIAITYTGNSFRNCATFRDFALRQKGRRGTAFLLDYSNYSLTYPGPDARFVIERVVAEGTGDEGAFGWSVGFDALAGAYGTFRDCEFIGYHNDPAPASSVGFQFRGTGTQYDNGHPVVCHTVNCMAYHCTTAFYWDGCEGAIGRDCNAVNVGTGYLFDGGDLARPQFVVDACHANFHSNGIVCDAVVDVTLVNNLLYTIPTTSQTDTTGIGIINAGAVSSVGHFLMHGNIFCDLKTTKAMTCIYVGTGTVASGIIDSNIFRAAKNGIVLDTGTSAIQVGLYNIYTFISSTPLNNLGSGNIINKFDGNASHYLDGTGAWTTPAGGSATQAFGTIAVSGQSSVIADAAPDTLTLVAGTNVTLTTNATADSVTIAASGAGGAPTDATYITQTANTTLTNEQALSGLTTGIVKVTTGTGVLSTAVANTDYAAAAHASRHAYGAADAVALGDIKLDANCGFSLSGSNPVLTVDTGNDYFWYDRTNNRFSFVTNNSNICWLQRDTGADADNRIYLRTDSFITDGGTSAFRYWQFSITDLAWLGYSTSTKTIYLDAPKIQFVPRTTPTSPSAGDVYYDSGTNKLRVYNASTWVDLH